MTQSFFNFWEHYISWNFFTSFLKSVMWIKSFQDIFAVNNDQFELVCGLKWFEAMLDNTSFLPPCWSGVLLAAIYNNVAGDRKQNIFHFSAIMFQQTPLLQLCYKKLLYFKPFYPHLVGAAVCRFHARKRAFLSKSTW